MSGEKARVAFATALCNRPLAAAGLNSYRCKTGLGWVMIGALDDDAAMREALRSCDHAQRTDLQVWNGTEYVAVPHAPTPVPA
jgi:hypothetical protein